MAEWLMSEEMNAHAKDAVFGLVVADNSKPIGVCDLAAQSQNFEPDLDVDSGSGTVSGSGSGSDSGFGFAFGQSSVVA